MGFIGNKPSAVPLTGSDLADNIITSAKIVLQTGDALTVLSDTASSLDSIVSVVDAVSA